MAKFIDLTGQQFGEWTALAYAGDRKWLCRCSCGKEKIVETSSMKSGRSKNCGDKTKHERKQSDKSFKDLTGQTFGVLNVINYVGSSRWLCQCNVCGTTIELLSKNIRNHAHSTCTHVTKIKPTSTIKSETTTNRQNINMIGYSIGDIKVVNKIGDDRYLCKCICGIEKEIRGYSLRNPKTPDSYRCKHKVQIGQRFGNLKVIERYNQNCICRCDCGNIKEVWVGNLLNKSIKSCGCLKKPTYTKEEITEKINEFKLKTGYEPFIYDVMDMLNLSMTAAYENLNNYNLKHLLNKKFSSYGERDIYNIIRNYGYNIELHNRNIISPKELDIYIPEKKIAIEFNGNYWHCESNNNDKFYHRDKTIACAKKGIRLIHIFEYEWNDQQKNIKIHNLIKDIFEDREKIQAKYCEIREVNDSDSKVFLEENHLQGYKQSDIKIGLYNSNRLISIMTFIRHINNNEFEIVRHCNINGVKILGGAEKLFKHLLNKYNPKSILNYVDISKFTGNIYTKLGFKVKEITEPNYIWVNTSTNEVLSNIDVKQNISKYDFSKLGSTEDEVMNRLGYLKVYNSGKLKMIWSKEDN